MGPPTGLRMTHTPHMTRTPSHVDSHVVGVRRDGRATHVYITPDRLQRNRSRHKACPQIESKKVSPFFISPPATTIIGANRGKLRANAKLTLWNFLKIKLRESSTGKERKRENKKAIDSRWKF